MFNNKTGQSGELGCIIGLLIMAIIALLPFLVVGFVMYQIIKFFTKPK